MQKITLLLSRRQHISVFISLISAGVLLGIALALLPAAHIFAGASWFVLVVILLIICFWKKYTWLIFFAFVSGILIGLIRAVPTQQQLVAYTAIEGEVVSIEGRIADDVSIGKHGEKQIKLANIKVNNKSIPGIVWVSTDSNMNLKRSFELTATGKISKGFGSFSAAIFRANIVKVVDTHTDKARELRDGFSDNVRSAIDEPQASLGIGYLVGQRSTLPPSLEESLRIVGLTHIVVASGYNLTILVRFARRLFAPISKYLAMLSGGTMIAGFIFVTGLSPSMTRAGLVSGLSLAAWYYGRSIHPLVLLPFVAAITVIINPSFMWGDLGWYLSFAAFAGVMILAPLLQNYFFGPKKPGTLRQIVGETLSAQLATMPIIAFSFGTIAIFALPANLLVLPFVPIAMALVFLTGLAGTFLPGISMLFGYPSQILLGYMTSVVQLFVNLPNASIEMSIGVFGLVVLYAALVGLAILLQLKTKHDFRKDNLVE